MRREHFAVFFRVEFIDFSLFVWLGLSGCSGYDSSMRSWGGENIDQSLRTWLCGGEIVYAEGSRVANLACEIPSVLISKSIIRANLFLYILNYIGVIGCFYMIL